mmetsp:Transcript_19324/g.33103  ORF Transcript_19324/g.33103 Transcript_19324/m.33103 type:complete len:92 (+) Transcript_19324:382-657(+)
MEAITMSLVLSYKVVLLFFVQPTFSCFENISLLSHVHSMGRKRNTGFHEFHYITNKASFDDGTRRKNRPNHVSANLVLRQARIDSSAIDLG